MITEADVVAYAQRIRKALTNLGFAYASKRGDTLEIAYKSLALAGDRYAVLEVDTNRLPPRVSIPRLETDEVLKHLSAVVGKPVKRLNTVGLTYVVILKPRPRPKPFPKRAVLPDNIPDGLAYAWPFGVNREGEAIWGDLLKTGHLLVGGKPGSGKSTFINAGLVSLLRRHPPDTLRLVLIDPKSVELWPYAGVPHLSRPVATTPEEGALAVAWLVGELERREILFKSVGAKSLPSYNATATDPLPLILAVIDELTDLVVTWGGPRSAPFSELIRVSSKGRAFGVVLCLATQNPKADILDTLVRENSGARIAFKVDTPAQSRCILGQTGAESLPYNRPGRLVTDLDGSGLQMLQGFTVRDRTITDLVAQLQAEAPSPLTSTETVLIDYARTYLAGAFRLHALYKAHKGVISWRQLQKLGRRWEARGWLTKPADAVTPRMLTATLLQLARLPTRQIDGEDPPAKKRSHDHRDHR